MAELPERVPAACIAVYMRENIADIVEGIALRMGNRKKEGEREYDRNNKTSF